MAVLAFAIAWIGSDGGVKVMGFPVFAICILFCFIIQWFGFIPAYIFQTEKYYDLTGMVTFLSLISLALWFGPTPSCRSWLLAVCIIIWSIRLGTFLFRRLMIKGWDRRFDQIKKSFTRFFLAWTLQGLWVSLSLASALAALTSIKVVEFGFWEVIGTLIWIFGFGIEVIADRQKSQFRKLPQNRHRFIRSGLWTWSRHPNYLGEIILWIGISIIALPALHGWQYLTLLSPLFVAFLIIRVSGIPLLEAHADEKWSGDEDYESYKQKTPRLIPKLRWFSKR